MRYNPDLSLRIIISPFVDTQAAFLARVLAAFLAAAESSFDPFVFLSNTELMCNEDYSKISE